MNFLVLDTDVASRLLKGNLPGQLRKLAAPKALAVTFVTIGEFYKGARKASWGLRRLQRMESWLDGTALTLSADEEVAVTWGRITAERERIGRPLPANDGWIAACCVSAGLPLMTLNRRHFDDITGLTLFP